MRKEAEATRSYLPFYKMVLQFLGIKLIKETGDMSYAMITSKRDLGPWAEPRTDITNHPDARGLAEPG